MAPVLKGLRLRDQFVRRVKHRLFSSFLNGTFAIWQRLGIHVVENDYHQPIPDTRRLPQSLWLQQSDMPGIQLNEANQLALLEELRRGFASEYESFAEAPTADRTEYYLQNASFGPVDAEVLYAMIRRFKPKRMIEIGCGNSTKVAARAVVENRRDGSDCEFVTVDPFPPLAIREGLPGLANLIDKPVEGIPLDKFDALEADDILFIDSSHVLRIDGDVRFEFLEVIPRLNVGVLVHVHDIFFPAEYPKAWVLRSHIFPTEQYLLQAFLAFNKSFEVLWAASFMHLRHPALLEAAFSSYSRPGVWPGSLWMRRTA